MTQSRISRILHTPVRMPPIHRRGAHVFFACMVWPGITILGAAWGLMAMPYYRIPFREAVVAGAAGTVLRLPDLILVGAVYFGLSGFIFSRLGAAPQSGRSGSVRLLLEPAVMFVIVAGSIAVWYPAILSQPLFMPFRSLPVAGVLLLLAAVGAVGIVVTGRRGSRLRLAGALMAMGLLSPAPLWLRANIEPAFGEAPSIVLLGVDSLSHRDDLSPLIEWVRADGGTWYERAVTPGLFTNAVWSSILTLKPVREHGIFHTFLPMQKEHAALLHAARAQGYRTVAVFPDQLTSAVGSTAGFDDDLSGPVGWRQLLLPMVANHSVLVPVLGAALPRVWPGASPSNEAGTFTYDVSRDVRRILRAGASGQPTLVAAHLTFTHLPAYPGSLELSLDEWAAVMSAPAGLVRDRTIDWQDEDQPGDPLPLNQWKIRHVQRVIRREVTDAGFLRNGGRLITFSDHGRRQGLTLETFGNDEYHHVPLATFGLPARCPAAAISLVDIGGLIGLGNLGADPSVEFVAADQDNWPALVETARFGWAGQVILDEGLLSAFFARLRRHDAWPAATCR